MHKQITANGLTDEIIKYSLNAYYAQVLGTTVLQNHQNNQHRI